MFDMHTLWVQGLCKAICSKVRLASAISWASGGGHIKTYTAPLPIEPLDVIARNTITFMYGSTVVQTLLLSRSDQNHKADHERQAEEQADNLERTHQLQVLQHELLQLQALLQHKSQVQLLLNLDTETTLKMGYTPALA